MPNYRVVLAWNVQKTYFVQAKDEEEATDKARDGEGLNESYNSYEFEDYIETVDTDKEYDDE
jgi:hypothetical protein|tara:strand:+ start:689 stop:874 length:186 start_codon:yes stop_codon:yes gene_type:complete